MFREVRGAHRIIKPTMVLTNIVVCIEVYSHQALGDGHSNHGNRIIAHVGHVDAILEE